MLLLLPKLHFAQALATYMLGGGFVEGFVGGLRKGIRRGGVSRRFVGVRRGGSYRRGSLGVSKGVN